MKKLVKLNQVVTEGALVLDPALGAKLRLSSLYGRFATGTLFTEEDKQLIAGWYGIAWRPDGFD